MWINWLIRKLRHFPRYERLWIIYQHLWRWEKADGLKLKSILEVKLTQLHGRLYREDAEERDIEDNYSVSSMSNSNENSINQERENQKINRYGRKVRSSIWGILNLRYLYVTQLGKSDCRRCGPELWGSESSGRINIGIPWHIDSVSCYDIIWMKLRNEWISSVKDLNM